MPRQEPGVRRSSPLPYELLVDGSLNAERDRFVIRFEAQQSAIRQTCGGFAVRRLCAHSHVGDVQVRDYAVAAGSHLEDTWALGDFENGVYDLCVYGPNGFYREFRGAARDPRLEIRVQPARLNDAASSPRGNVEVQVTNRENQPCDVEIAALSYNQATHRLRIGPGETAKQDVDTKQSFGWYDFNVRVADNSQFEQRFAGRMETGQWSFSDPLIGRQTS